MSQSQSFKYTLTPLNASMISFQSNPFNATRTFNLFTYYFLKTNPTTENYSTMTKIDKIFSLKYFEVFACKTTIP